MLATVLQELRTWQLRVHLCVAELDLGLTNPQQNGGFVPLMNDIFTGSRKRTCNWIPYNKGATQVHKGAWIQNRPLELFPLGLIQDWCHWDALVVTGTPLRGDGLDQLQTAGVQNPMGIEFMNLSQVLSLGKLHQWNRIQFHNLIPVAGNKNYSYILDFLS